MTRRSQENAKVAHFCSMCGPLLLDEITQEVANTPRKQA